MMPAAAGLDGHAWKRTALLAAVGGLALLVGLLVYLSDRDASSAALIPRLALPGPRHSFGSVGQWLPSFVHSFAFSLLTAAALIPSATSRLCACATWGLIDIAFEVGQHARFKPFWAAALQGRAGEWAPCRWTLNYELHGSFDPRDITAAVFGALVAAFLLQLSDRFQEVRHATP